MTVPSFGRGFRDRDGLPRRYVGIVVQSAKSKLCQYYFTEVPSRGCVSGGTQSVLSNCLAQSQELRC